MHMAQCDNKLLIDMWVYAWLNFRLSFSSSSLCPHGGVTIWKKRPTPNIYVHQESKAKRPLNTELTQFQTESVGKKVNLNVFLCGLRVKSEKFFYQISISEASEKEREREGEYSRNFRRKKKTHTQMSRKREKSLKVKEEEKEEKFSVN